jgi:hypothetical protein
VSSPLGAYGKAFGGRLIKVAMPRDVADTPLVQAREKARRYAETRLAKCAVDWLAAGQL